MVNDQTTSVESSDQFIWVFCGYGGGRNFPSGVFSSLGGAEAWITRHKLSGVLTRYPVNTGVYDWAIANDFFKPSKPLHTEAGFIQQFSSASMEHYHYTEGTREGQLRSATAS